MPWYNSKKCHIRSSPRIRSKQHNPLHSWHIPRQTRNHQTSSPTTVSIVVKIAAGVGVKLRQIYLSRRRSHHPNDAPQQTIPNPKYKTEEWDPPPSYRRSGKREGEGINAHAARDLGIWSFGSPPPIPGVALPFLFKLEGCQSWDQRWPLLMSGRLMERSPKSARSKRPWGATTVNTLWGGGLVVQ
jgi:hypothetical protein